MAGTPAAGFREIPPPAVSGEAAHWLPYTLPLRQSWHTAGGTLHEHRGRLLRLTAGSRTGWGDAAPLPEFGIDDALANAFAEECARLDLAAQAAGLPLNAYLSERPPLDSVAVNANLGALLGISHRQLQEVVATGFRVVKLKVGIGPVAEEIAALAHLAADLPTDLRLRLDANRAWNETDAARFIAACTGLPIEGLEEPLATPTVAVLERLQAIAGFSLGIDESVELLDAAFWDAPPVRRLIIKPARHGRLRASLALARQASAAGMEVVVTSALESACGLLACAHLAAAVAPDSVHGLATADWLAADTGTRPPVIAGRLYLTPTPGIGFQPNAR